MASLDWLIGNATYRENLYYRPVKYAISHFYVSTVSWPRPCRTIWILNKPFLKKKNPKVLLDKKHQGKFSLLRCPCILVCEYKMLQNATFKKKSFLKVFFLYRLPQMAATSSVFSQQTRPETLRDGTRFFTSVNLAIESISVSLIAPSCWKIKKSTSIISAPK